MERHAAESGERWPVEGSGEFARLPATLPPPAAELDTLATWLRLAERIADAWCRWLGHRHAALAASRNVCQSLQMGASEPARLSLRVLLDNRDSLRVPAYQALSDKSIEDMAIVAAALWARRHETPSEYDVRGNAIDLLARLRGSFAEAVGAGCRCADDAVRCAGHAERAADAGDVAGAAFWRSQAIQYELLTARHRRSAAETHEAVERIEAAIADRARGAL